MRKDQKFIQVEKRTYSSAKFNKNDFKEDLDIYIHRGAGIHLEHNSMEAFQYAINAKVKGIELDIWLTKDKKIMVIHGDENVDGKIGEDQHGHNMYLYDMTADEIRQYLKSQNKFCQQPYLEEVLDLCKNKLIVDIELKGKTLNGVQIDLAMLTIDLVRQKKMEKEVFFSSFNHEYYQILRNIYAKLKMDEIPFGFLFENMNEAPNLDLIKYEKTSLVFPF